MSIPIVDGAACEILAGLVEGFGKRSPAFRRQSADAVDQCRSGRVDVFDRVKDRTALVEIGRHQADVDTIDAGQKGCGDILQYEMASSRNRRRAVEPIEIVAIVDGVQTFRRSLAPGDFIAWVVAPGAVDVAVAGEDGDGVRAVAVETAIVFAFHRPVFLQFVQTLPPIASGRTELNEAIGVAAGALAEGVQARPASQRRALEPAIGRALRRLSDAGAPVDPRGIAMSGVFNGQIVAGAGLDLLPQTGGGVQDQQYVWLRFRKLAGIRYEQFRVVARSRCRGK